MAAVKRLPVLPYSEYTGEYDQEITQSQTTDNTMAPQGRAKQPSDLSLQAT